MISVPVPVISVKLFSGPPAASLSIHTYPNSKSVPDWKGTGFPLRVSFKPFSGFFGKLGKSINSARYKSGLVPAANCGKENSKSESPSFRRVNSSVVLCPTARVVNTSSGVNTASGSSGTPETVKVDATVTSGLFTSLLFTKISLSNTPLGKPVASKVAVTSTDSPGATLPDSGAKVIKPARASIARVKMAKPP